MSLSRLLAEKRSELGGEASKLRSGLFKISDTREKVEAMSVELEEAKKQVAEFKTQCDEYLSVILQQKKEADKQQKVMPLCGSRPPDGPSRHTGLEQAYVCGLRCYGCVAHCKEL